MKVSVARRRRARLYRASRLDEVRRGRRSREAFWRAVRFYLPVIMEDRDRRRQSSALRLMLWAWSELGTGRT